MERSKVTILDIANAARVSKSTVSRVLNNTTHVNEQKRRAVLAAMKRLNYKPNAVARSLAGGQSMTFGIVIQNIGSAFYDSVTQGIIQELSDTQYSPIIVDGRWDSEVEKSAILTLVDRNVDGFVIVGGNLMQAQYRQYIEDKPFVIIAKTILGMEDRCIAIDNKRAAKKATQHLIDFGHQRIAHLMGLKNHVDAIARFEGYREALEESGIPFQPELVAEGDFSSPSGVLGAESLLLRGTRFSAIFCANDEMAYGARLSLYRRGIKVPEEVSLVGFDDQPVSAFATPPLTTVAQPAAQMGSNGAKLLLNMLQRNDVKIDPLDVEVVVRESVKRLN
ncbi:MAG: LacI family DNA-binding transcriptional regulator [Planctomycetota bacterium]